MSANIELFKDYIEEVCEELARVCRETQTAVGNAENTNLLAADTLQKWFDLIGKMTQEEFNEHTTNMESALPSSTIRRRIIYNMMTNHDYSNELLINYDMPNTTLLN